jgi:hypothetical protein
VGVYPLAIDIYIDYRLDLISMDEALTVHFDPFTSRVDGGFWHELAQRKLEKYKLSEAELCIQGSYSNGECIIESECNG